MSSLWLHIAQRRVRESPSGSILGSCSLMSKRVQASPCGIAGLVRWGVIASRPTAAAGSSAAGARRLLDGYERHPAARNRQVVGLGVRAREIEMSRPCGSCASFSRNLPTFAVLKIFNTCSSLPSMEPILSVRAEFMPVARSTRNRPYASVMDQLGVRILRTTSTVECSMFVCAPPAPISGTEVGTPVPGAAIDGPITSIYEPIRLAGDLATAIVGDRGRNTLPVLVLHLQL